MALTRRAQTQLSARITVHVRQTVGPDTEAGQAVIHSYAIRFPAPPDEPQRDAVARGRSAVQPRQILPGRPSPNFERAVSALAAPGASAADSIRQAARPDGLSGSRPW